MFFAMINTLPANVSSVETPGSLAYCSALAPLTTSINSFVMLA
jgi:hypothetical protein